MQKVPVTGLAVMVNGWEAYNISWPVLLIKMQKDLLLYIIQYHILLADNNILRKVKSEKINRKS
ncbi:MAG: hypothetical protein ACYC0D_11415 [Candidatus Humimicrobiaceae bacterium]